MSYFMEESLEVPLGKILPVVQEGIMDRSSYFGVKTLKNPADAWTYQEIIFETRPDVIVEIGNKHGGATLMLAHLCDLIGKGKVIGLDITHASVPPVVKDHPRITLIEGDACDNLEAVTKLIADSDSVLIIEDSSHTYENTLNVLHTYSPFVKPGGYFIVEDSVCHHGLTEGPKPGPYEAIDTFVAENHDFEIDRSREKFVITWNPKGYLKRVSAHLEAPAPPLKRLPTERPMPIRILKLFVPPIIPMLLKKLLPRKEGE